MFCMKKINPVFRNITVSHIVTIKHIVIDVFI